MTRSQRSLTGIVFVVLLLAIPAAGQACHFGDALADQEALSSAPTCEAAYKQYQDCRWGSSADGWRGRIVRDKCEPLFLSKLTVEQMKVYNDKIAFCGQQYEFAKGTLAISESNTCAVGVIVAFATDPNPASKPLPFASFDCSLARTPIEKTICSNPQLGRADLLVSTAYKPFFNAVHGDARAQLITNQRAWNATTPVACHFETAPATHAAVACLIAAYKKRAGLLNECFNGLEVGDCLHIDEQPKPRAKSD